MIHKGEEASHLGHAPVIPALRRPRKFKSSLRCAARPRVRGERRQAGEKGSLVQPGPASHPQCQIVKGMLSVFGETRIRKTAIYIYIWFRKCCNHLENFLAVFYKVELTK